MTAGDVQIELEKGTVDFSSVEGGNGITILDHEVGGIDVNLGDGDIVVAPTATSQIDLFWDQPCGYVCLPEGHWADDSSCRVVAPDSSDGTDDESSGYGELGGDDPDGEPLEFGEADGGMFRNDTMFACFNNTYLYVLLVGNAAIFIKSFVSA